MNYTALPGVMRYIFSGQDARTTRVSSFNFVPHKSRNRCKLTKGIGRLEVATTQAKSTSVD